MKKRPGSRTGAKIQRKSAPVLEPEGKFEGKTSRFQNRTGIQTEKPLGSSDFPPS